MSSEIKFYLEMLNQVVQLLGNVIFCTSNVMKWIGKGQVTLFTFPKRSAKILFEIKEAV